MEKFDEDLENLEERSNVKSLEWMFLFFISLIGTFIILNISGLLLSFVVAIVMVLEVHYGSKEFKESLPAFYFHSFFAAFVLVFLLLNSNRTPALCWYILMGLYLCRCGVQIKRYLHR